MDLRKSTKHPAFFMCHKPIPLVLWGKLLVKQPKRVNLCFRVSDSKLILSFYDTSLGRIMLHSA